MIIVLQYNKSRHPLNVGKAHRTTEYRSVECMDNCEWQENRQKGSTIFCVLLCTMLVTVKSAISFVDDLKVKCWMYTLKDGEEAKKKVNKARTQNVFDDHFIWFRIFLLWLLLISNENNTVRIKDDTPNRIFRCAYIESHFRTKKIDK